VDEVIEIPITEADDVVPVALAAVLRLRIVLPVMVLVPLDDTIPLTMLEEFAEEGT